MFMTKFFPKDCREWIAVLLTAACVTMFSGCGGNPAMTPPDAPSAPAPAPAPAPDPTAGPEDKDTAVSEAYVIPDTGPVSLWVVTEASVSDGMDHQIRSVISAFGEEYPHISIRLDILPVDEAERAAYLEDLDAQIGQGGGPDVYLLPTSNLLVTEKPREYSYYKVQPLFPSVDMAMRGGYFLDIRELYDSDAGLGKDALQQTVMEAGTVGESRYVLPLRYNVPCLFVFDEALEKTGFSGDPGAFSIDDWMTWAVDSGDPALARGTEYISMHAFSAEMDYGERKVALAPEQLASYMELFQKLEALVGTEMTQRYRRSLVDYCEDRWAPIPVQIGTMESSLFYAAVARAEGKTLSVYPVRTVEGDTVATVSYYGAVGANCAAPEAAYGFLRLFLTEEYQWELSRPQPASHQYEGLVEGSWPVRIKGSAAPLWANYFLQTKEQCRTAKAIRIGKLSIDDTAVPALDWEIDIVRFPIDNRIDTLLLGLNDIADGNAPIEVDFMELASDYIEQLEERFFPQ